MAKKRRPDGDTPAKRTRRTIEETTQRSETIEEFEAKTGHLTRRIVRSENKDARITEDVQSGPGVNLDQSAALGRLPDDRTDRMVPDQWKVSIFDSFVDAPLSVADFAGDYLVSRVPAGAPEDSIAWESVFIENQGLSRLCVTARVDGRRLLLTVEIDGRVPGPRWTGVAGDDLRQPIRLQRDRTVPPAALANDDWPTSVLLVALTQSGRHATSEQLGEEQSGSRYHISPAPTAAERAMMAGGGSSSCSSSSGCQEPEPDPTPPCEESEEECCESDASSGPIRYFNGEVQLTVTDLAIRGFGSLWGQQRVYSNRLTPVASTGNGVSWLVEQWPYLIESNDLSITMVKGTRQALWFDAVGSDYEARFGAKSTLVHDAANEKFVLTRPGGEQWLFHDFDQTTNPPGIVSGHITAGGQATEVASYTAQDQIAEITRSMVVSGQTTTASFLYSYTSGGDLESVLYQTRVDTGAWNEIRRVQYEYYGSTDLFGNLGDLKRSRVQVPAGSGWTDTKIRYYRYYTANTTIGFQHGLKFVLNPAAYNRMLADSLDPQLAGYANFYYEYDSQRRATREIVDAGSRTFTFTYTQSAFPDDYNNWKVKTVETLPDATQNMVYTNYIGQILIKEHKSGTDRWIEYFQFSSDGRKTLAATPAAVIDYDDSSADLNVNLRTAAGKIHLTEYYTSSGGVGAKGYVQARKIQQGTSGTPITLQAIQYTSRTANGVTVYPVSQRTVYRNDDASGAISTSYAYTWYTATVQQKERITTLPVVSTSQNGSGVAATRKEYFDEHGYAVWSMNERGFISRRMVDVPTGAITKTIEDVDTSLYGDVPSGWVTPSGGGLNLVTDYDNDDLGRPTQTLGPAYTIDLSGTATPIRSADWTVYADAQFTVRTGRGYQVVADSSFTLINPVNIAVTDAEGRPEQQIRATRGSGVTSSGKLLPTDSFAQSSYTAWSTTQYIDCCIVASQRVYHTIPASGAGSEGTHYEQTSFGYDVMKRRNRTITSDGTIMFSVFDSLGRTIESWTGTNDTGATSNDPSGGGALGNNMVQITGMQYDDGIAGGNSNLTQQTQYVDESTTRVTSFDYDWRDRRTTIDAEEDLFEKRTYDNLDRVVKTQQYDTTASGNLVALSETRVDDRGHVYQSVRYGVDPATGAVGNSLTDNTWFDAAGNPIKDLPAGAGESFTKRTFNSLGWNTATYTGFGDDASYSDVLSVIGDVILQETETARDHAGNVIQSTQRERYHNAPASQTGPLGSPALTPNARITYTTTYPDGIGRTSADVEYGTAGGTSFTRPATIPATSDTVLVSRQAFDPAGELQDTTDPAGKVTRTNRDAAGRTVEIIDNYVVSPGTPSSSTACSPPDDTNQTVRFTYTPDSNRKTITAVNADTGDQVTQYIYGTTLASSGIATSHLLSQEIFPDSTGPSDRITHTYNRQSEETSLTDQNERI